MAIVKLARARDCLCVCVCIEYIAIIHKCQNYDMKREAFDVKNSVAVFMSDETELAEIY